MTNLKLGLINFLKVFLVCNRKDTVERNPMNIHQSVLPSIIARNSRNSQGWKTFHQLLKITEISLPHWLQQLGVMKKIYLLMNEWFNSEMSFIIILDYYYAYNCFFSISCKHLLALYSSTFILGIIQFREHFMKFINWSLYFITGPLFQTINTIFLQYANISFKIIIEE